MLRYLRIRNLAVIDDLSLEFEPGLNIITGDTGAGKSILIDAVGMMVGARGSADMIRSGADQARITAQFDLNGQREKADTVAELGVDLTGGELVVQRILSRTGRGRITVNGDPVTVGLLKRMWQNRIDIHGQQEHHSLLNREHHIELLDAFGKLEPLLRRYGEVYQRLIDARGRLDRLESEAAERARKIDFLQYQIGEIDGVKPLPGEEKTLAREAQVLRHAEQLSTLAREGYAILYESEDSLSDRIGGIEGRMKELSRLDPRTEEMARAGEELKYRIEDLAHALRDYASGIEPDPERLAVIEDRLDRIRALQRKYGPTCEEILRFRDKAVNELEQLSGQEEDRDRLRDAFQSACAEAGRLADELSLARKKAARSMEQVLEQELSGLAMSGTRFEILVRPLSPEAGRIVGEEGRVFSPRGWDRVEFRVSPNPGEDPKSLNRIASGGELSRIMLALKAVLASVDRVGILIFDEIDTGIGGGTAEVLGRRLRFVAEGRQVICVTHLPQVASQGQTHTHVAKEVVGGRTRVTARSLSGRNRVREIARMLGGVEITPTTLRHAEEMLHLAGYPQ